MILYLEKDFGGMFLFVRLEVEQFLPMYGQWSGILKCSRCRNVSFFVDIVCTEHLVFGSIVDNWPIWRVCAASTGERVRLSSLSGLTPRRTFLGRHFSPTTTTQSSYYSIKRMCGGVGLINLVNCSAHCLLMAAVNYITAFKVLLWRRWRRRHCV